MNFVYKILCKTGYHAKIKLIEVSIGFGPSGKVEKVQCEICNKIYFRRNNSLKLNPKVIIIVLLIFLILLFLL